MNVLRISVPDEEVDNNTYTNRILRFVLEKAFELIRLMEYKCPEKLQLLKLRIKITEKEMAYWQDIIEKLYIKDPDPETKVIEQHDGYFELEDISLEEYKSRLIGDEYPGYPAGPAVNTRIIKQADVIQLLVMFKNEYHPIVRLASFDYYDLRTEHGSGDSPNAYGIVAAQAGRLDRALYYFLRSARIDLESTNAAAKANFTLGGVHIASSGATWQVIHFGFSGFELENDVLAFHPVMPKGWTKIQYAFYYKYQRLCLVINKKTITIRSSEKNELDIKVKVNDQPVFLLKPSGKYETEFKNAGNHYFVYNDTQIGIKTS